MKKVLIAVVALVGLLVSTNETKAQTQAPAVKIAFFDFETMLQVMPGYPAVDSILGIFQRDSLTAEREFYQSEFKRLDSTWRADSAAGKPKNVLDLIQRDRYNAYYILMTWNDYEQNRLSEKRDVLAGPMMQQLFAAYQKVAQKGQYALIIRPDAIESIALRTGLSKAENLFIPVAKELKIQLPPQLGGAQDDEKPTGKPTTTPKRN